MSALNSYISSNQHKFEKELSDSISCKRNCIFRQQPKNNVDLLLRVEHIRQSRLYKTLGIPKWLEFICRLNAKFYFVSFRKSLERIHLALICEHIEREFSNNDNKESSVIVESLDIESEHLKILAPPSLAKFIGTLGIEYAVSCFRSNIFNFYLRPGTSIVSKAEKKLRICLSSSSVTSYECYGTMNLVNRILAFLMVDLGKTVKTSDHGFLRDCCAEYYIGTDHQNYDNCTTVVSRETLN